MGQIVSMMKEMGYLKMFGMNVSDVFKSSFEKIVNPCAIRAAHNLGIPIKTEGLRSKDHMHEVVHMIMDSSFNLQAGTSEASWTEMQIDEMVSVMLIERDFSGNKTFDKFEDNDSIIMICSSHPTRGWATLFSSVGDTKSLIEHIAKDVIRVEYKKKIQKSIVFALKKEFPTNTDLNKDCEIACKAIACIMNVIARMTYLYKQVLTEQQEILYRQFNLHLKCEIRKSLKLFANKGFRAAFNVGEIINVEGEWIEQAALKQNLPRDFFRGFLLAGIAIASKAIGVKN